MGVISRVLAWIFEALAHAPALDDADASEHYYAIEFGREPSPVRQASVVGSRRPGGEEIRRIAG